MPPEEGKEFVKRHKNVWQNNGVDPSMRGKRGTLTYTAKYLPGLKS